MHFVTRGFACRYKRLEDGERQIVALLLPGDFADPFAFLRKSMSHCISTFIDSKVVCVSREKILEMLKRPALARALYMSAMEDTNIVREWVVNLALRSGPKRLAHAFCEIHMRMDIVGMTEDKSVRIPLSQKDIGDLVGLSLVHTKKSLQVLREMNLIRLFKKSLAIVDYDGLQKLSGFSPSYFSAA